MHCHICQAEAVTRCYNCGELVCEEHGKNECCPGCVTGFAEGDPRGIHVSVEPISKSAQHAWWRPQEAEAFQPPACYECKGLSRAVCRNCRSHYCREHAGPTGLCKACGKSANLGLYLFFGTAALMVLMAFLVHWFGR
jgi:hypothetical protein